MARNDTTIRLKKSTWRQLHERKDPGDSFDDVILDLIDDAEQASAVEN